MKAEGRLSKIKPSHFNNKYNSKFNDTYQKETSYYKADSVKALAESFTKFNRNLNDLTVVYCNDSETKDEEAKKIAFRLMR